MHSDPNTPVQGLRAVVRAVVVVLAGFAAASLASMLEIGGDPLPFWPGACVALAFGWRFGRGWILPAGLGAAFSAAQATGSLSLAVASFAGAVLGPTLAVTLLTTISRTRPSVDRLGALVRFIGAVLCVAAPVDSLCLLAGTLSSRSPGLPDVGAWWLVDATAMLLLTPALLALIGRPDEGTTSAERRLDGVSVTTAILLSGTHLATAWMSRTDIEVMLPAAFVALAVWTGVRASERACAWTLVVVGATLFGARGATAPLALTDLMLLLVGTIAGLLVQAIASDRAAALRRLSDLGNEDPATGLPNDNGMVAILSERLEPSNRPNYGLVGVQLSNLDAIHDLCGMDHATAAEQGVASLLMRQYPTGRVARLARGRFALLMPCDTVRDVRGVAREIYAQVNNGRASLDGPPGMRVAASVGGLLIEGRARVDPRDCLVSLAGTMAISANARDPQLFVEPLSQAAIEARRGRQRQVEHVHRAIRERRLELHAEPMLDTLAPPETLSFEILTRLRGGQDGQLIMPREFLPMAAESRLTVGLDRGVVHMVFEWLASNPAALGRTHRCSINLSGPTISDTGTGSYIRERRARFGIPAEKIIFEITESEAIRNPAAASRLLDELKSDGFRIALDDFGTGLASFDYLKRFPVDYLKIDGSFIRHLLDTPLDEEIVLATVRVARRIGVRTTAEHVRDQETLDRLLALGVDVMQGEFIGRPVPISKFFERRTTMRPVLRPAELSSEAPVPRRDGGAARIAR